MAEFSTNPRMARVDMTPMVDLGFLLITFFMYTTSFNKPFEMPLVLPKNSTETAALIDKNTLTLILGKDDKIFWHQKNLNKLEKTDFKNVNFGKELRNLILVKRQTALKKENFTVIIHPTDECNYGNVVDILDEMSITNQKLYALSDIFQKEKEIYQSFLP
jgi:biopolymer transport protein ExbD